MIDVPIPVRDALKDGSYKKNYRFIVGSVEEENVYTTESALTFNIQYTLTRNGDYRLCNDFHSTGITYTLNGSSITITELTEDLAGGYYCDLGSLVIGDTITITAATYDIDLRRKTTETQEIFQPEITIENDKLVKESVKIDERMCSDDDIKFGLCEGSALEFQAFNIDNITGKRIQTFVDVYYPIISYSYDETTDKSTKHEDIEMYSIPMGWFDVQETSRQASTGIKKVSAYNKLKSDYLDADASVLIKEAFGEDSTVYVMDILHLLLKNYGIKEPESQRLIYDFWSKYLWSNPRLYFTPFRYTQSSGVIIEHTSRTLMNPAILMTKGRIYTTTNIYVEANALMERYYIRRNVGNVPIQFELDSAVNYMDTAIVNFIKDICDGISTNCGGTELWNRIHNMNSGNVSPDIADYFFYVRIHFYGGNIPDQFYGNNLRNPTGSFTELANRTFTNVNYVEVVTPLKLRYSHLLTTTQGDYLEYINDGRADNDIYLIGGSKEFVHHADNAYEYLTYTPPLMPDGTISSNLCDLFIVKTLTGNVTPADTLQISTADLSNITLRDLQTAVFEMQCQFGKLDRINNIFTGVELNNGRLYPADDLYPDNELYPLSTSESGFRAMYSRLWADEGNIRKWRYLVITYKGLIEDPDTHEVSDADKMYITTIDEDGTDDYEINDNWLFKNLVWADSETENLPEAADLENIEDYAAAMVAKMTSISWFPFEMWCAGLPYIETGDEIEINIGGGAYTSYVLRRTIKGIQNLQDEMIDGTLDIF